MASLKTAEARLGQRGTTAFFVEANALLPGQGTANTRGKTLGIQPRLDVARAKGQAAKTKRTGADIPSTPRLVSAKRRGGKEMASLKTAEARLGQRGTTAFFVEANVLLPGQGTASPWGESSVRRIHGNSGFLRQAPFSPILIMG